MKGLLLKSSLRSVQSEETAAIQSVKACQPDRVVTIGTLQRISIKY